LGENRVAAQAGRAWLWGTFRNPHDPSGGATVMSGCSLDSMPQSCMVPSTCPPRPPGAVQASGASGGWQAGEGQAGSATRRLHHFAMLIAEQEGSAIMTQAAKESMHRYSKRRTTRSID